MNMYRQGDVLLVPAQQQQGNAVKNVNRVVLAYGEATGHHHSMPAATTQMVDVDGRTAIYVSEPTPLTHQEHSTIEVSPGWYWVVIQREYTPEVIRNVRD